MVVKIVWLKLICILIRRLVAVNGQDLVLHVSDKTAA